MLKNSTKRVLFQCKKEINNNKKVLFQKLKNTIGGNKK